MTQSPILLSLIKVFRKVGLASEGQFQLKLAAGMIETNGESIPDKNRGLLKVQILREYISIQQKSKKARIFGESTPDNMRGLLKVQKS